MSGLRATLPGPEGSADALQALRVLTNLVELLGRLEVQDEDRPAGRWEIVGLKLGSVQIELAPAARSRGEELELGTAMSWAVEGFAEAEEREVIPAQWSIYAAELAADIANEASAVSGSGLRLELLDDGKKVLRSVIVTRRSSDHLRTVLPNWLAGQVANPISSRSIGSVIGRLETYSVHGRQPWASLWPKDGGRRATIRFDNRHAPDVLAAIGQRVEVTGLVERDHDDRVIAVKMTAIDLLPESNRPLTDLIGAAPNLTNGMDPDDYLREMRGAA